VVGVAFSRDPESGEPFATGNVMSRRQAVAVFHTLSCRDIVMLCCNMHADAGIC
jgi:hypothetical protein